MKPIISKKNQLKIAIIFLCISSTLASGEELPSVGDQFTALSGNSYYVYYVSRVAISCYITSYTPDPQRGTGGLNGCLHTEWMEIPTCGNYPGGCPGGCN